MSLVPLHELLIDAQKNKYALCGFVCLGWEDARAYVDAAIAENSSAILMVGPGARASMPIEIWGHMLGALARGASVPLAVHLDHGKDIEEVSRAIKSGFSSVMYDGSALPIDENISKTKEVATLAHNAGVSCEGEIGFVGYSEGAQSLPTDPDHAARFALETGVDCMAVSVGNAHLQTSSQANINMDAIRAIEALTNTPLVIHGGSGVPPQTRALLATKHNVKKFNIGTELRQVWGASLRQSLTDNPQSFDRLTLLKNIHEPLADAARKVIANLKGQPD